MEQLVTIDLFGQSYTFKTDSEVSKAEEIADFLVKEVNKVESQHSVKALDITKFTILILAALNIANKNFEIKRNNSEFLNDVSQRLNRIIRTLDENIV
ncbi:MAG: cell division protein ZapA [Desulfobacteraceae bacterium]|nr:cell division protein ZapA [Pseudomonadota bacterium]MBU4259433.1 cell division protein ZapA [Pseudomonadota bacterium]MBU4387931.1 cell division protein ZapA [Pseudomonadota bacterium]MBU4415107.1 cell division protein ZapA [Pseudomonadota bacterium]MCG2759023.1 cell division protein ZapA [Desulfobacteraceae bacterium]